MTTAWVCCVRLNDGGKIYFTRQVSAFATLEPTLFAWEDDRADRETLPSRIVPSPWSKRHGRRGEDFIRRNVDGVRSQFRPNVFGAKRQELRYFTQFDPPDVIYAHNGQMGLRMLPVAEQLGVPLVVHFHGIDVTRHDRAYRTTLPRHTPSFASIIVVADWMKDRLASLGVDTRKVTTIPMGAPRPLLDESRIEPDLSNFSFVFTGRLVATKGVDRIVRAFSAVHNRRSEATLTIVGGGPALAALVELVQTLGVEDRVRFTGTVPAASARDIVSAADVFVHHPVDAGGGIEASSVAVAEAMMLEKPIIASRCGGLVDQVVHERTGFLVEQDDVDTLAARMIELCDDPGLAAEMGRAGRQRSVERFDSQVLATTVEDHLRHIAQRSQI